MLSYRKTAIQTTIAWYNHDAGFSAEGTAGGLFIDDLVKIIWPILFVVFVAVLLCLFIPILILLELFLILAGALILTAGGILITKEVVKLEDLWHRHKMKREYHELEICKLKWRHALLSRHRRSIRERNLRS